MKRFQTIFPALRLALIYIVLAGLWILFSDRLLAAMVQNTQELTRWQSYKGIAFVLVMALLLFIERHRATRISQAQYEIAQQNTALFEQTPNPVFVINLDNMEFLEVNRAAQELYGFTYDEFLKLKLNDLVLCLTPEDIEGLRALKENQTLARDTRHRTKDGRILELSAVVRRLDWKGYSTGLFVYTDMTARRKMEESIENISKELQAIVNASPLAIITADLQGNILSWNAAAERIFGWNVEEVQGKPLPFVTPEMEEEARIFREGVVNTRSNRNVVVRRVRKDGVVISLNTSLAPLLDAENNVVGVMGMMADITEQTKAEEELRTTRELLKGLLENAPLPIYMTNRNHQILLVNHAWETFYGMPRADVIGKKMEEVYPYESAEMFIASDQEVFETGQGLETDDFADWEGSRHYFRTIKFPLLGPGHNIEAVGGISMEVTERKQMLEALYQLNNELEQRVEERTAELAAKNAELETFAYSVSHDLKAPLRGIDGYSRLLQEEYTDKFDQEGQHFLAAIRDSSNRMSQLIDDLLMYSRMERRKINLIPINPQRLLDGILAGFAGDIQDREIQIKVDIPFSTVYHDAEGLQQALQNLVDNAIKFTANTPTAEIEIGGRQTESSHILWVKDNGPGFEEKYNTRIFEIFQRLHRMEEFPGTGIGLAIVRKAMQRVGGSAWAESTLGEGSTFYLEMPIPRSVTAAGSN